MARPRIRIEGLQAVVHAGDDRDVASALGLLPRAHSVRHGIRVALTRDVAACLLRLAQDVQADPPVRRMLERLATVQPSFRVRGWCDSTTGSTS